jgi:hypothetical protein
VTENDNPVFIPGVAKVDVGVKFDIQVDL